MNYYNFDIPTVVGQRIKDLRKKRGYTQAELAERLNMSLESRRIVGQWEDGEKLPPIDKLLKICGILGCDMGFLFGDYDCETYDKQYILNETGLTEKTVNVLRSMRRYQRKVSFFITAFFESIVTDEQLLGLVISMLKSAVEAKYYATFEDELIWLKIVTERQKSRANKTKDNRYYISASEAERYYISDAKSLIIKQAELSFEDASNRVMEKLSKNEIGYFAPNSLEKWENGTKYRLYAKTNVRKTKAKVEDAENG